VALTLGKLVAALPQGRLQGNPELAVSSVTADSRQAGPDTLFVAVRGTTADGHRFLDQVAASGCRAVVVEEGSPPEFDGVVTVADTRPVPALAARLLHRQPDLDLLTAGVTGTNGKTTVAFLMRGLLGSLHGPCGLLGTISYHDGAESIPAPLTTPGGPVFYRWLARMRDNGARSAAMEISSHALDQGRTAGLGLDVAIMTNLGRDHLDYHADMQEYLQAKARILDLLRPEGEGPRGRAGVLVLNADDPHLAGLDTRGCRVIRFSARPGSEAAADLLVTRSDLGLNGTRLELAWQDDTLRISSPLVGRYNVENLTAALAAGLGLGFPAESCVRALAGVEQVPGRLERIALPSGGIAVVDYAHTHDALAAVLGACDELVKGRLITVFGCGGDRDRGKRPLMGEVAARGSDLVWITSDNPRSEDPQEICRQIRAGYDAVDRGRSRDCKVVADRTEGIEAALEASGPGDIVVIAGKGHEDYQLVGDRRLDLDDRVIVRRWAARKEGHA
jgi:UDP-N-acetylmuramoyl-L-alanyl-D-glutamate--2,6-diaminopimelate ligase